MDDGWPLIKLIILLFWQLVLKISNPVFCKIPSKVIEECEQLTTVYEKNNRILEVP